MKIFLYCGKEIVCGRREDYLELAKDMWMMGWYEDENIANEIWIIFVGMRSQAETDIRRPTCLIEHHKSA